MGVGPRPHSYDKWADGMHKIPSAGPWAGSIDRPFPYRQWVAAHEIVLDGDRIGTWSDLALPPRRPGRLVAPGYRDGFLSGFLNLTSVGDEGVFAYAQRWGGRLEGFVDDNIKIPGWWAVDLSNPLLGFVDDDGWLWQPTGLWRALAGVAEAAMVVGIALQTNRHEPPPRDKVDTLAQTVRDPRWFDLHRGTGIEALVSIFITGWLHIAGVSPALVSRRGGGIDIGHGGGLSGALAMSVALHLAGKIESYFCSGCQHWFDAREWEAPENPEKDKPKDPQRKQKSGAPVYCQNCIDQRVPERLRARKSRAIRQAQGNDDWAPYG